MITTNVQSKHFTRIEHNEWELTIVDFFSQFRLVPCYPLPHHKVQYEAQKKEKKIFRDDERG